MDLSTTIGNIKFDLCMMNASGCWCTTENELEDLKITPVGAIVSKSSTIEFRKGNDEPRLYVDTYGSINSMGLANLGYKFYRDYMAKCTNKHFIQSIHPFSISEFDIMLTDLDEVNVKRLVEVNISCPNLIHGTKNLETFEKYFDCNYQKNLQNISIGYKLPPFFQMSEFEHMSRLLLKYNIKFITCVNSLPNGLMLDYINETTIIKPKNGLGGIGGLYLKPTGLANVYQFSKLLDNKVDIIGCGGISHGSDIFEYILSGAKAVQVGTHLLKHGPNVFNTLKKELTDIMLSKKYNQIQDFYGKLNIIDHSL